MDSCHCKLTDLEHLSEGKFPFSNLPASIPALNILCQPYDLLPVVLVREIWLEMSGTL